MNKDKLIKKIVSKLYLIPSYDDLNYSGKCPYCSAKSFNINPKRGIYKCFGCSRGGLIDDLGKILLYES